MCVAINLYYFQIVALWGDRQRPSKWRSAWGNVTDLIYKKETYVNTNIVQLNLGYAANLAYKQSGYEYRTTRGLRKEADALVGTKVPTCRDDFIRQAGQRNQELCEGYCTGCVLGGDTFIYPYMPLYVAGLWSIVVVLSAIFIPIISILLKINANKGNSVAQPTKDKFGGYTSRDARVYLLLLLAFVIFAVTLFLIRKS